MTLCELEYGGYLESRAMLLLVRAFQSREALAGSAHNLELDSILSPFLSAFSSHTLVIFQP